jgi:LacI family transcriptional regulator
VPVLHATLEKATAEGYLLIFMDTANDHDHQTRALATLHDRQVDALLVIAPELINYGPMEVMSTIPTILVNCLDPSHGLTSIVADEYAAGSAAARVLIEAGHRRIGVVAGPLNAMDSRLRLEGIEATAAAERTAVFSPDSFQARHHLRLPGCQCPAARTEPSDGIDLHP